MPTKKFQAETMMEALEMVQRELGSDAIVLSSREVPVGPSWQVWRKPGIEVIAMAPDKKAPPKQTASSATEKKANPVVKTNQTGNLAWEEDRNGIEWVNNNEPSGDPSVKKVTFPYQTTPRSAQSSQTQTQTQTQTQAQTQAVNRTAEFQTNYIPRTTGNSTLIKRDPSEVLPIDKPAVSTVPPRQNQAQPIQQNQIKQGTQAAKLPEGLAQIKLRLLAQGVDRGLVDRIVQTTLTSFSPAVLSDESRSMTLVRKQLEAGLNIEKNFLHTGIGKMICLVGASGSGKTTTISKLAVHFSQAMGKKVVWISADTIRAGAIAETKAYADAIGVPLRLAYTPEDLTNLIRTNQDADLILVDTPGYNPCDEEQMVELGSMLTQLPERSTFLVAPATTKEADLLQAVASLGLFKITGLIITKMDETYSFGSVYNFVYQSQLPMVLFSYGKQVLGDLHQADAGRVVSALFGKGWD